MTAAELAKEVGVSSRTIRNYANEGIIPGKNFGGKRWVFEREKALKAIALQFGNAAERDLARRK